MNLLTLLVNTKQPTEELQVTIAIIFAFPFFSLLPQLSLCTLSQTCCYLLSKAMTIFPSNEWFDFFVIFDATYHRCCCCCCCAVTNTLQLNYAKRKVCKPWPSEHIELFSLMITLLFNYIIIQSTQGLHRLTPISSVIRNFSAMHICLPYSGEHKCLQWLPIHM